MCPCANCQWKLRSRAQLEKFIKDNPQDKEWAEKIRKIEDSSLPCFNNTPSKKEINYLLDWQDGLGYEDAQEVLG